MNRASVMRLLRKKYGISLRELAETVGVSQQFISDIELGKYEGRYDYKKHNSLLMQAAFEKVIKQKREQARQLSKAFEDNRDRLLVFVTEDHYEL